MAGDNKNVYIQPVEYMALDIEQLREMPRLQELGDEGWAVVYAYAFRRVTSSDNLEYITADENMTRFILTRRTYG